MINFELCVEMRRTLRMELVRTETSPLGGGSGSKV